MTGLGGDELLAIPATQRTGQTLGVPGRVDDLTGAAAGVPWLGLRARSAIRDIEANLAPVPVLPLPALMSLGLHNPTYVQVGIWPVAPLTEPELVRFAEQLPVSWRQHKTLLRERLRRAGLPRHVTHPTRPETFSPLMQHGLRHHGLPLAQRMLTESILIDAGYIDGHRWRDACQAAARAPCIPSVLCDTIALELGLHSVIT